MEHQPEHLKAGSIGSLPQLLVKMRQALSISIQTILGGKSRGDK